MTTWTRPTSATNHQSLTPRSRSITREKDSMATEGVMEEEAAEAVVIEADEEEEEAAGEAEGS